MKKLILALIIVLAIQSCRFEESEETKITPFERDRNALNRVINDTITLSDGHLYYHYWSHGYAPIHSQYCQKNH